MSLNSGQKLKKIFTAFLVCGSFLFTLLADSAFAYNTPETYQKLVNGTLTSAEWNGLLYDSNGVAGNGDFVNTWLPAKMNGPLGIATSPTAGISLDVNGIIRASNKVLVIGTTPVIGIGDSNPADALSVVGNISGSSALKISNSAANSWVSGNFGVGNASNAASKFGVFGNASVGTGYFSYAAPTDGLIIQGNVGIGTTNPNANLDVNGIFRVTQSPAASWNYLSISNTGNDNYIKSYDDTGGLHLQTQSGNIFLAEDRGNVGVGTTLPYTKLDVMGATGAATTGATANGVFGVRGISSNTILSIGVVDSAYTWLQGRHITSATYYPVVLNPNGGNVGIGTTTPAAKLQVNGNTVTTGLAFASNPSDVKISWADIVSAGGGNQWMTTGANISNTNTGNVGVGTTTPLAKFHVSTGQYKDVYIGNGGAIGAPDLSVLGASVMFTRTTTQYADSGIAGYTSLAGGNNLAVKARSDIVFVTGNSNDERFRIQELGNVGIGTSTPNAKLQVNGAVNATGLCLNGDCKVAWSDIVSAGGGNQWITSGNNIYNSNSANVGIGDTAPVNKLSVVGDIAGSSALKISSSTANNWISGNFGVGNASNAASKFGVFGNASVGTGYFSYAAPANGLIVEGNVGVGTTAPGAKLHVYNNIDGVFNGLAIDNRKTYGAGTGINETSRLDLSLSEGVAPDPLSRVFGYMEAGTQSESSSADGWMAFGTRTGGSATEKLRINAAGNVGIGTTNPSQKLDVYNVIALAGKKAFDGGDSWLRINNDLSFSAGIYAGGGTFRTDGVLQVGSAGATLNVASGGNFSYNTNTLFANTSGNVGIGTTTPNAKLQVNGAVNATGLCLNGDCKVSWSDIVTAGGIAAGTSGQTLRHNGTSWVANSTLYNNGTNIGIGDTAPANKLSVVGDIAGSSALKITNSSANNWVSGNFGVGNASNAASKFGVLGNVSIGSYYSSPAPTNGMIVEGNVGIGTTNPGANKLYVAGDTTVSGNLNGSASNSLITNFILDTHPESSTTVIPFINNDIAYVTSRGGSCVDNLSGTCPSSLFNGAPDYAVYNDTDWATSMPSGYTVEITFQKPFSYSDKIGVSFGNASWRSKYIKVEVYDVSTSAWRTVGETSTNALQIYQTPAYGVSPSYAISKMRFTFNDFASYGGSNFRISEIWLINYSSLGAKETLVGRDGSTMYGTLNLANSSVANTISLNPNSSSFFLGNLGIGTTNPTNKLQIQGSSDLRTVGLDNDSSIRLTNTYGTNYGSGPEIQFGQSTSGNNSVLSVIKGLYSAYSPTGPYWGGDLAFYTKNYTDGVLNERFRITSLGNVGIGTTNPNAKLQVNGSVNATGLCLNGDCKVAWSDIVTAGGVGAGTSGQTLRNNGSTWVANSTLYNNGTNIGIGDTAPVNKLSVAGDIAGSGALKITNSSANNWVSGNFGVGNASNAASKFGVFGNASVGSTYFTYAAPANSLIVEGNIGIGTTNPTAKLDIVGGNIDIDNTTFANQFGVISKNGTRFIHDFNYGNNGTVTTSGGNIFVGNNSGNFTMGSTATYGWQGSYNTAIGGNTLQYNTIGYQNSALGFQSLLNNTTGSNNVSLGYVSLNGNTVGSQNTGLGNYSLNSNVAGSNGTAIGLESQRYVNNTSTPWTNTNTSVGYQALRGSGTAANNTGNYNNAFGYASLSSNTTGNYNNAFGYLSLYSNTTGSSNTGFGYVSLQNNTTGGQNTAIGHASLLGLSSGNDNTALGYVAGRYIADGSTYLTTANQSTFLGDGTKAYANGDTNETVIGYNATGIGSNTVTIGNDSVATTVLKGNVGIGTTTPNAKLQVMGSVNATGLCLNGDCKVSWSDIVTAGGIAAGTSGQTLRHNGTSWVANSTLYNNGTNIGVGDTAPVNKLSVAGDIAGSGALKITNSSANNWVSGNFGVGNATNAASKFGVFGNASIGSTYFTYAAPTNGLIVEGNVGVGTTNPNTKLDVSGILSISNGTGTYWGLDRNDSDGSLTFSNASSEVMRILQSGNVGIGTTNPAQGKLWIQDGSIWLTGNQGLKISTDESTDSGPNVQIAGSGNDTVFSNWSGSSFNERMRIIGATGFIGIGTTNPLNSLHVNGSGISVSGTTNIYGNLYYNSGFKYIGNGNGSVIALTDSNAGIGFYTADINASGAGANASISEKMIITNNGNIGIGTTTPNAKLQVNGAVNATGLCLNGDCKIAWSDIVTAGGIAAGTSGQTLRNNGTSWVANSTLYNNGTNVGVGDTAPANKLSVAGDIAGSGALKITNSSANNWVSGNFGVGNASNAASKFGVLGNASIGSSYFSYAAPTDGLIVQGNVGIGTTNPISKLQVSIPKTDSSTIINQVSDYAGAMTLSVSSASNNGDKIPLVFNVGNPGMNHISSVIEAGRESSGWNTYLAFYTNNITSGPYGTNAVQEKLRITGTGNVGIGTTAPGAKLTIAGSDNKLRLTYDGNASTSVNFISSAAGHLFVSPATGSMYLFGNGVKNYLYTYDLSGSHNNYSALTADYFTLQNTSNVQTVLINAGANSYFNGGNVGIGITNPNAKLQVNGSINATGLCLSGDCKTAWSDIVAAGGGNQWITSGSNIYNANTANVGIGDTSPLTKLSVVGDIAGSSALQISNSAASNWLAGNVGIGNASIGASKLSIFGNQSIGSSYYSSAAPTNGLIVEGNVGIGVSNPGAKLQVNGGMILKSTTVADADYTAKADDYIIGYTSISANRTVTLPNALCTPGRFFVIVDESGSAGPSSKIIIDPEGTTPIIGQQTLFLQDSYNSVYVFCGNSAWYIL